MEESLNKVILEWWYHLPDKFRGNLPTFIHPLNSNAQLLFVGLNPSGDTSVKPSINSISEDEIQAKIKLETMAIFGNGQPNREGQYKLYYKPISNIADELKLEFEHCDLFHMSFRTAKIVVNELLDKNGVLKEIHNDHLQIFISIFNYISPKVVITNNVVSANILKGYLNLKFDSESGLYKDTKGTYFYLNGIMSYGRHTSFDKERLIWQIRKVL